jgi:lipopolysaccharide biosynthesis glycosyltransferase
MTVVAFFADRNVLPALHVAIASTLAYWPGPDSLEIHLFHRGLRDTDLTLLRKTVDLARKPVTFFEAPFDVARIRHWRPLYGSHMPYGRLFLPQLLPHHNEVIYLDADVVVEMNVRGIVSASSGEGLAAAMPAWDFAHSHDAEAAAEFGIAGTDSYYHSGLLVLELEQWRVENLLARCLEVGDRLGVRLKSHDQTIFNIVCHGRITPIPPELTTHLYPTATPDAPYAANAIRNFCGSPKPYDPLGNILNVHFELFDQWLASTALAGWSPNSYRQLGDLRRSLRLLRPMFATAARTVVNALRRPGRISTK